MKGWLLAGIWLGCLALAGCGGGGGASGAAAALTGNGSLQLQIDLAQLTAQGAAGKAASEPITAVTATLSRDGYGPKDFELTVSGTTATGRIDNLPLGYMHVALKAYSGTTLVYTGSTDVAVTSGPPATARVLLDPVAGSLVVEVGLNPYPGTAVLNLTAGWLHHDPGTGRTYLSDSSNSLLAVYDAELALRKADYPLPGGSLALTMASDGAAIYVGCRDGQVYRLDSNTGATTPLVNVGTPLRGMVALNDQYLLVAGNNGDRSTALSVIDVVAKSVVASQDYGYHLYELVANQNNGMVYALDANSAETHLHRLLVDPLSGALSDVRPVVYGSSYPLASPVRVVSPLSLVTTAAGNTFTSSTVAGSDLQPVSNIFVGNLFLFYRDLVGDAARHAIYALDGNSPQLMVLRDSDFALIKNQDIPFGNTFAVKLFHTANSVVLVGWTFNDPNSYVKVFSKSELGLAAP